MPADPQDRYLRTIEGCHAPALAVACLVGQCACVTPSLAQTFPVKPIRLIVGFTPGTATDIIARIVAHKLAETLGQQVIIENRDGAGGTIAAELAMRASPDGYTLWVAGSGQFLISPFLYKPVRYDPVKDFAPIALLAAVPNVLVVHPSLPVTSVKDLIALAKAKRGQINYASSGKGSASYLNAELFKNLTGVEMVEIPYKSTSQAMADLIAGQDVSLNFPALPATIPYIRSGRLRALAVTGGTRSPAMPDLPTMAEAGVATYESTTAYAIAAPAGTPKSLITRFNGEMNNLLRAPDVREKMLGLGAEPLGGSPEDLARYIRDGLAKWGKLIKALGIAAN